MNSHELKFDNVTENTSLYIRQKVTTVFIDGRTRGVVPQVFSGNK